jgi:hypothetical protein
MTALVAAVQATAAPPWTVIDDELLREIALHVNPYVKIGGEPPVANLRAAGWLADVVDKLGWDEAIAKYPEVDALLDRLRETLQIVVAGIEAARLG